MDNFVVIDFETATPKRDSACQVALVSVINNEIIDTYSTLIKPPGNRFAQFNVSIHGINAGMTLKAPTFTEVFNELNIRIREVQKQNFEKFKIVSHNNGFDRSVFKQSLITNKLDDFENMDLSVQSMWFCTMMEFRRLGFPSSKLNELCKSFNIELNHHDAKSDTLATTKLMFELKKINNYL